MPIGTNGKPLAAIGKFPSAIGKLMIGKILATAFEFQLKRRRQNNFFADLIEQISIFALVIPSAVFGSYFGMLFYLINHYKAIINCSVKPVNNSK